MSTTQPSPYLVLWIAMLIGLLLVFGQGIWSSAQLREARRQRAAICQMLDAIGADPQTAADRWPCEDVR